MQVLQGEPRAKSYRYTHADSLGSISFITDEDANIVEQRSYEPFGEIRSMNYGNGIVPANMTNITTRSFTNHEQIGEMEGLIHMDGRVYDSSIGRFVSADIHVPHPYSTQSYNRYSYVKNNPLGFTDPSGYDWRIVNKEGFKEHLIQQKMDTAPTSIQTSKDHTPKNGSVRSWATQQVRLENPNLFADGGNYKLYLIDTESGFFGDSLGKLTKGNSSNPLYPAPQFNGDINNYNQNIMWNEYNNDPTINSIRTYYAADEASDFFAKLSLASYATRNPIGISLGTAFGANSIVFAGVKHWSAYELGVFNLPQATVDFGAVGKGVKPLGKVTEEAVNYGAGKLMGYSKTPNKFYDIPKEEQTEAHRTYMEFMQNHYYNKGKK